MPTNFCDIYWQSPLEPVCTKVNHVLLLLSVAILAHVVLEKSAWKLPSLVKKHAESVAMYLQLICWCHSFNIFIRILFTELIFTKAGFKQSTHSKSRTVFQLSPLNSQGIGMLALVLYSEYYAHTIWEWQPWEGTSWQTDLHLVYF